MKKILSFTGLMTVVLCCLVITTSCHDYTTPAPPTHEREHGAVVDPNFRWTTCNMPTYIGNIEELPADLQTVIRKRFTNQVDLASASIAFVDAASAIAPSEELKAFTERDGVAVIVFPKASDSELLNGYLDYDNFKSLFFATNVNGEYYTLFDEEVQPPSNTVVEDRQYEEALEAEMSGNVPKEQESILYYSTDNLYEKNLNYWENRVESFMAWLNDSKTKTTDTETEGDESKENPYERLLFEISSVPEYNFDIPIELNNQICKGLIYSPDSLNCSSNVRLQFRVFPFYAHSENVNPGDYYIVRGRVVPRNQNMWRPDWHNHGWAQTRVIGYWMDKMDFKFFLSDSQGNALTDGISITEGPYPVNMIKAKQVGQSFQWGLNGGLSGGIEGLHSGKGGLKFGFNLSWSNTISYTEQYLDFTTSSVNNAPGYHWSTSIIQLYDFFHSETNEAGMSKYYPRECRSEYNAEFLWIWHAHNNHNGIEDYSKKELFMTFELNLIYNTWHHWRAAIQYDSNRQAFSPGTKRVTVKLPRPYRNPWGLIAVKNSIEDTSIRDITICKEVDGVLQPVKTIDSSFEYHEKAITHVDVGTYAVKYNCYSSTTGEFLYSGVIRNVAVKMASVMADATKEVSTSIYDMQ